MAASTAARDGVALGARAMLPRRALLYCALLSLALGASLYESVIPAHSPLAPARARLHGPLSRAGLLSLPAAAQGSVSSALGADSPAYRLSSSAGGLRAANPVEHLSASFTSSGVSITSGATHVGLGLRGVGYGSTLSAPGAATPRAGRNRVLYARRGLAEWYANGPLGIEQGFNVSRPAGAHAAGPLTLAIALSGNAQASLGKGGQSITLSRSGKAVLRYGGLSASDARGRALHSWLALQGGRLLLRVDARGARYPLRIDPFAQAASFAEGTGGFGFSVAVSSDGNTALVGGPLQAVNTGTVWVFARSGSTWAQQGLPLKASGETGEGLFGYSLALSANGNTALIGGRKDNVNVGAAWVFTRSGEKWTQQGEKLKGTGEVVAPSGEYFGFSVSLSSDGNTALIGGYADNGEKGAAYVFTRSGSTWTQQGEKLTGTGLTGEGDLGWSVALSSDGNTALIGADIEPGGPETGAAYVFTRSAGKWTQQGEKLRGTGLVGENPFFGSSVAVSSDGNTALIGASGDNTNIGAAYVFTRSAEKWTQQGSKLTGSGEVGAAKFGWSVALSPNGNTGLIGGPLDNANVGAAWVFTRSGEAFTQQGGKLTAEAGTELAGGHFGKTVSLSSSAAWIGGPVEATDEGDVWVFETGPVVSTGPATESKPTGATVNATVNPAGELVTECKFEYGTTTSYGSSVACSSLPGSGSSPVAVSASVTGLAEGAVYHFRITAANSLGEHLGSDRTFTTLVSSASATTTEEKKPAEATDGQLSTKASGGTGTITVGKYGSNPGGPRLLGSSGKYIDDYRSSTSTFQKVEFSDCELNGAKSIDWWNPKANAGKGEWQEVSRQTYVPGEPACVKAEIEASGTSPTVTEMTGTRFGTRFGTKNVPTPPEFGRCVAGPTRKEGTKTIPEGLLTASTCLLLSQGKTGLPEGKYEWELEVLTKAPFTTKLTSGSVTLQSALTSSKVTCTGESSGGEYTGAQTVGAVVLTLTGCSKGTEKCATAGRSPGEVLSKTLEGTLGVEKKGTTTAKNKVALELFPVGKTGPFAEFNCAGTSVSVRGAVIVPVKPNAMSLTQALKFVATKGKQKPELFEGGSKAILEESFNGGAYEQTGLTAAITQTNKEKLEVNSVL